MINWRNQAILTSNGRPLGECRFREALMAACKECGKKLRWGSPYIICDDCNDIETAKELAEKEREINEKAERNLQIDAILLTTETAPNLNITKR
ncbi:MAG: hypothetical protein P8O10_02300, partial [Pseudorhodobacter sp.]|nr:hypothetical protein [Pseudorhodobacter sp.]